MPHNRRPARTTLPTWSDRLTCVPAEETPPTHTSTQATDVEQWSEAAHKLEQQPKPDSGYTPVPAAAHPKTRVFRWFEHARKVTGMSPHVLAPHEWHLYTAPPQQLSKTNPVTTTRFFAHTLLHHSAAVFASTAAATEAQQSSLYRWALDPTCIHRCAASLSTASLECVHQTCDPGCNEVLDQVEVLVQVLYEDQHRRFMDVQQELRKASVSESSPLHTVFATFSPAAQATSVVQQVLFAVWRTLRTANTAATPQARVRDSLTILQDHFRRKYDDEPDVKVCFNADAMYVCAVHHLDGHRLGSAQNRHRGVAVESACAQAIRELRILRS